MTMASHYLRKRGGTVPVMDGDAIADDVLTGKTFYNTDATNKLTGTAVFQTGDISIIVGLQAEIELVKTWNQISWVSEQTLTIEKSWEIV